MKRARHEVVRFSADMHIAKILELHPQAQQVFNRHALPCERCVVAEADTLGECLRAYGLDVQAILEELNALPS